MKKEGYFIIALALGVVGIIFYDDFMAFFYALDASNKNILYGMCIYTAIIAGVSSDNFIQGAIAGLATVFATWYVFGQMFPGQAVYFTVICIITYAVISMPFIFIRESKKESDQAQTDEANRRLDNAGKAVAGQI